MNEPPCIFNPTKLYKPSKDQQPSIQSFKQDFIYTAFLYKNNVIFMRFFIQLN